MRKPRWLPTLVGMLCVFAVSGCSTSQEPPTEAPERASNRGATRKAEPAEIPDLHDRPIVEQDGRTLLWANEDEEGNVTEWFDMTDSTIDPHKFQFGIGKDRIASIDDPEFVPPGDPRLGKRGVTRDSRVLGVEINGIAKAYPVNVMTIHEVVNDDFGGEAYAVLW